MLDDHRRALIVGNPDQTLPHAEAEAQYVAELLRNKHWNESELDILLTKDATKQNFLLGNKDKGNCGLYSFYRGYTLVHLSTHATYDFHSRT